MATKSARLHVAVIGLEFGAEFVPIYRDHLLVASVSIADPRKSVRDAIADDFGIDGVYESLDAVLGNPDIDAVHIVTGLPDRAKHVASTVPMAFSFDDIQRIVDARERAGTTYMMMETAVYTREYLFAEERRHCCNDHLKPRCGMRQLLSARTEFRVSGTVGLHRPLP